MIRPLAEVAAVWKTFSLIGQVIRHSCIWRDRVGTGPGADRVHLAQVWSRIFAMNRRMGSVDFLKVMIRAAFESVENMFAIRRDWSSLR